MSLATLRRLIAYECLARLVSQMPHKCTVGKARCSPQPICSRGLSNFEVYTASCTIMNHAILITADNIGGYSSGPFQPSFLTPSTASAHTNGLAMAGRYPGTIPNGESGGSILINVEVGGNILSSGQGHCQDESCVLHALITTPITCAGNKAKSRDIARLLATLDIDIATEYAMRLGHWCDPS
jgi:hypothetical protein